MFSIAQKILSQKKVETSLSLVNSKKVIGMTVAVCCIFGTIISNPAQISLEAQAVQLDSEVANLTKQVANFDSKIRENLNVWVDYTKLENYAPSEIEIVIPPNFDPKQLELEGEVMIEEVAETTVSPSKTQNILEITPSPKTLKITQRQTVVMEKLVKADKIAKKFKAVIDKENLAQKTEGKVKELVKKLKDKSTKLQISRTDLRPLYESLYPSKKALQNLNKEILQEKIEFKKQEEKIKNGEVPMSPISFINNIIQGPTVSAGSRIGLSNIESNLIMYMRDNSNLALDVPYNNQVNGQILNLWNRNNATNQNWRHYDNTLEIKSSNGKCLDLYTNNYSWQNNGNWSSGRVSGWYEVYGKSNYYSGAKIQLWDCNGSNSQKWQVTPEGQIKPVMSSRQCSTQAFQSYCNPKYDLVSNYCLDASQGLSAPSKIHLWQCHGGNNQKWGVGQNDFQYATKSDYNGNSTAYKMTIYASGTARVAAPIGSLGHAFVGLSQQDTSTINTFSNWPTTDYDSNNYGRAGKNNIGTSTNINVDNSNDINVMLSMPSNWRQRSVYLSKIRFDEIKYMRGYSNPNDSYNFTVFPNGQVCSGYSLWLYNKYVGYGGETSVGVTNSWWVAPADIYNAI